MRGLKLKSNRLNCGEFVAKKLIHDEIFKTNKNMKTNMKFTFEDYKKVCDKAFPPEEGVDLEVREGCLRLIFAMVNFCNMPDLPNVKPMNNYPKCEIFGLKEAREFYNKHHKEWETQE